MCQTKSPLPVNYPEIHRLAPRAHLGRNFFERNIKNLRRDKTVNIHIRGKCLTQRLIARKLRQQAKLYL